MTDRDALLRSVLAAPDDDAPRLVYADWLDIDGPPAYRDVERAEFIRVQCELSELRGRKDSLGRSIGHTNAARIRPLMERERRLLAGPRPEIYQNEVCWFNAGDGTDTWRYLLDPVFRRGFVESVTCTAADWLAHAGALSWSPGQTVPCPACGGPLGLPPTGYQKRRWDVTPCERCAGRKVVPRPCPPTAHPVAEVRLTGARADCRYWTGQLGGARHREVSDAYFKPPVADWTVLEEVQKRMVPLATADELDGACLSARWPSVKTWHLPPEPRY